VVAGSDIAAGFQAMTMLYPETYARRISDRYATLQHKLTAIGHFWRYLHERHPHVTSSAGATPAHARGFVPYAIERARTVRRGARISGDGADRLTAHAWLVDVRTFFADVCTGGTEPHPPFAGHVPAVVPLTRHDLLDVGFKQARQRREAHVTSLVMDLQREIPNIRAFALRRWHEAEQAVAERAEDPSVRAAEGTAFWDSASLELLLASGLRVAEACELTTFDILKWQLGDGRIYYLLHVKPSKFDRARVIPIGDQLGRVIAEIIRHVRAFHGTSAVPPCDRRDIHEKTPLPRAPLPIAGSRAPQRDRGQHHPRAVAAAVDRRPGAPSRRVTAGAGTPRLPPRLRLRTPQQQHPGPRHRRVARTRHIGHSDGVRQALPHHARRVLPASAARHLHRRPRHRRAPRPDRRGVGSVQRQLLDAGHGHPSVRPTHWRTLCKGLVCLGCNHAQPKKSAAPTFRRMLASHTRALTRARETGEPAGQVAARQLEIDRIHSALRRAEELSVDVAAAIEAAAV
jgi:hypothetical protein